MHVFGHYFKVTTNEYSQNVKEGGISQGQGQGPFLFYFFFSPVIIKIDSIDLVTRKKIKKERKEKYLMDFVRDGLSRPPKYDMFYLSYWAQYLVLPK